MGKSNSVLMILIAALYNQYKRQIAFFIHSFFFYKNENFTGLFNIYNTTSCAKFIVWNEGFLMLGSNQNRLETLAA